MKKIVRNTKGFTLIELMIVVAIIGILAAIAIPQFAQYRMRSFNSAAQSDMRNMATNEAGLFTDVQSFGVSAANAAKSGSAVTYAGGQGTKGVGEAMTGPADATKVHTLTVTVLDGKSIKSGIVLDISNNVTASANIDELVKDTNPRANSYVVGAKHKNGNSWFAQDSDNGASYVAKDDSQVGTAYLASHIPASTINTDDIAGAKTVVGVDTAKWQIK